MRDSGYKEMSDMDLLSEMHRLRMSIVGADTIVEINKPSFIQKSQKSDKAAIPKLKSGAELAKLQNNNRSDEFLELIKHGKRAKPANTMSEISRGKRFDGVDRGGANNEPLALLTESNRSELIPPSKQSTVQQADSNGSDSDDS